MTEETEEHEKVYMHKANLSMCIYTNHTVFVYIHFRHVKYLQICLEVSNFVYVMILIIVNR